MPDQDAEVGSMVADRCIKGPEFSVGKEEVIGCRKVLFVMNNTRIIKWHDAEHAATSLEHPALYRSVRAPNPSHFADKVTRMGLNRLGEVIQLMVDKASCVGSSVKNNRRI